MKSLFKWDRNSDQPYIIRDKAFQKEQKQNNLFQKHSSRRKSSKINQSWFIKKKFDECFPNITEELSSPPDKTYRSQD